MSAQDNHTPGRGRVLDCFAISRGTVVVVDILEGVWHAGSQLVCAEGRYRIKSVEAIDGQDVPPTAIALLLDEDGAMDSVSIGEEVTAEISN